MQETQSILEYFLRLVLGARDFRLLRPKLREQSGQLGGIRRKESLRPEFRCGQTHVTHFGENAVRVMERMTNDPTVYLSDRDRAAMQQVVDQFYAI